MKIEWTKPRSFGSTGIILIIFCVFVGEVNGYNEYGNGDYNQSFAPGGAIITYHNAVTSEIYIDAARED